MQEIVSSGWLEESRMLTMRRRKLKQKLQVCGICQPRMFGFNPGEMLESPRRILGKEVEDGRGVCVFVHFGEGASSICMIL